jgi:cytochrome c-type biogenesis protein CcmH
VIRTRLARLLVIGIAVTTWLPAAQAVGAQPRTSLTAVENDLMCVACHEPLAVSQSPEAAAERRLIAHLIALGDTKAQVERVMVAQYGSSVLAKPPASGFDLTVYVLPPVAVLVGVAIVGLSLARWRRARREVAAPGPVKPLSGGDARRLEEDLARYKG